LKRYSDNLFIAFDMDVAGDTATKRGIDLAQLQGFNVKVIVLPKDFDPADVIFKNPKDWGKYVKEAKSILDFYFESAFSKFDKDNPEGKREISKILLPVIKRIPNRIEQSYWIQKLAEKLEVKEEDVEEEFKKVKLNEEIYGLEPEEIISLPQRSRKELIEERLLILILKYPQNISLIEKGVISYFSPQAQEVLIKCQAEQGKAKRGGAGDENKVFIDLGRNQTPEGEFLNYLSLKAEIEEIEETEEKDILPEIQYCLKEIQSLEIKSKLDQVSKEIKKAEEEKDLKKIEKLIQEFNQLAKEIGR